MYCISVIYKSNSWLEIWHSNLFGMRFDLFGKTASWLDAATADDNNDLRSPRTPQRLATVYTMFNVI